MKRGLAVFAIIALVTGASWAQSFADFKSAFENFSGQMASSLAVNSTVGFTWSDASIGDFPHFGAGLNVGAAFTGEGTASPLFAALGKPVPLEELDQFGIPIPAVVASVKLGLPFLGMDIGVKGGIIWPQLADSLLSSTGVYAEYKNLGAQLRIPILRDEGFIPALSLGFGASYQQGRIKSSLGAGDQTIIEQDINGTLWAVTATDPLLDLGWESMIYDGSAQISKRFFGFLTPYVGLGYSFGSSTVTGGVESVLDFWSDGTQSSYDSLAAAMEAAGLPVPDIDVRGFSYTTTNTDPVLRLYGGLSIQIFVVLDLGVMYVPSSGNFGASVMARIQF